LQPPVVKPGSGFTAPTPQPAPIGAGFGVKDLAIARFDVVPYQTFTTTFLAGVVAFHSNGIARVSFSANGGPWVDVKQMTLNPQTNVKEYVAALNAPDFPDGQLELRAIAYPTQGTPRVLDPLFLNADSHATLPTLARFVSPTGSDTTGDGTQSKPFATLVKAAWNIQQASPSHTADNGTVYLQAGDYNYGTATWPNIPVTSTGWVTFKPAPGVSQSAVRIVSASPDGLRTGLVHLVGLTVAPVTGPVLTSTSGIGASLWVDNCRLIGQGATNTQLWTNGFDHQYVTGTEISNSRDGMVGADLARGVNVHDIGEGAFNDTALLVNCTASNIDSTGTTFHPDVLFLYGRNDNAIAYGLTAVAGIKAQGMFIRTSSNKASNIAWVNCNVNNQAPTPGVLQVFEACSATNNLLVDQSSFVGPAHFRTDLGFSALDVIIRQTTFSGGLAAPGILDGVSYI
jgi:hypothetical protein